ncbi:MAG: COX15/CtaA family protein [Alphaproteobacteria bacterium]|nr:COX15/CtaA family protein [Alphaproteobacteria bacterium]
MNLAASQLATGPHSRRPVGWWLLAVALLIAAMVVIGGLTRLTGSGLSITEWDPIIGVIPPVSQADWIDAFHKYQRIPQYLHEHRGMALEQFQFIYWWEWTHRLLGRLIGFVFLLPFLLFVWTGAIARRDIPRMVVLFALGGLQGFVGWWMVQSGLETRVSVSQYRLAIHLGVALLLFAAILWAALTYLRTPSPPLRGRGQGEGAIRAQNSEDRNQNERQVESNSDFRLLSSGFRTPPHPNPLPHMRWGEGVHFAFAFAALVYLQMLLGALVAGLHAGLIYNTWPTMDGRFLPEHPFFNVPWWINFFDNPGLVQFDHRMGGYIVAMVAFVMWWNGSRHLTSTSIRMTAHAILFFTTIQIALGIETLLNQAPILLSALHQLTALALLSGALWHAFELRRSYAARA